MPFASHVLVPTDFSQASMLAVDAAATVARELRAKVTIVHVHDPEALRGPASVGWSAGQQASLDQEVERAATAKLTEIARERLAGIGVVDQVILHDASAARAICAYAEKIGADLIVIATHGRTGMKHLLIGSVADASSATRPAQC